MKTTRILIVCGLALGGVMLLVIGATAGRVDAATPTPTPTSTPIVPLPTSIYTDAWATEAPTMTMGLWEYGFYAKTISMARTWFDLMHQNQWLAMIIMFSIIITCITMFVKFLVKFLRSKSESF